MNWLDELSVAITQREQAIEGAGTLGWATYLHTDEYSAGYSTAASTHPDDSVFVDGREVFPDSMSVVFDEQREARCCEAVRTLLTLFALCETADNTKDGYTDGYLAGRANGLKEALQVLAPTYGVRPATR